MNYAEARNKHTITCGNGKTVKVSDSKVNQAAAACLRAGHPAPKKKANLTLKRGMLMSQNNNSDDDCKWDPNDARLPDCKKKLKKKDDCKWDPDSAKLPCVENKRAGLLLPAVQSATEASCGSSSSISRALDQCGKKGHKFAACKKKGGNWTCSPSKDNNNPNVRPTGFANRR